MSHVTLRIYANKEMVHNVVADIDLHAHVRFNQIMRPGCLFYVDGQRMCDGLIRKECLSEYDALAKEFFDSFKDTAEITAPYN